MWQFQFVQFVDESVVPNFVEGLGYVEDYRTYFIPRVLISSLIGGFYQVGQVVECLSIFSKARLIFVNNLVFIEESV